MKKRKVLDYAVLLLCDISVALNDYNKTRSRFSIFDIGRRTGFCGFFENIIL